MLVCICLFQCIGLRGCYWIEFETSQTMETKAGRFLASQLDCVYLVLACLVSRSSGPGLALVWFSLVFVLAACAVFFWAPLGTLWGGGCLFLCQLRIFAVLWRWLEMQQWQQGAGWREKKKKKSKKSEADGAKAM